jgi:hypothetical protein
MITVSITRNAQLYFDIVFIAGYNTIYDIYFVNCNWVDTRWQQYSTVHNYTPAIHQTTQCNRIDSTYIKIKMHKHNNKNS